MSEVNLRRVGRHQKMDQSGEREKKNRAQQGPVDAGRNGHQAQRCREGARCDIGIHDEERGSGNGKRETCGRKQQGTPPGRFAGKEASSQVAAGGEEEKYRQYIGCEKRPREWQVRDSDDRSHSPREG